ncbi:hypothetical protein SAMN02745221_01934 [Thermosyntropha lipolytica DSM 11003]|uniref:N-acetyltransferase domain-containing protein n=1 Tax=Thermosyntropha lipolytica DSM 11003 TaxID=1123382 RepID=A0A1M5R4B3_9FIRM|nr:hypothetical protein [Thermosyntropha lipolytica]SHH21234.1 hypothetical protein SAMN02745221_01934 [Thermosyntropha lipolytica DSM 11003]
MQNKGIKLDENINPEAMGKLVEVFLRFVEIRPWEWMSDADLFAVQIPGEEEIFYACVLGNGGIIYGLALYPGNAGLRYYLLQNLINSKGYLSVFENYGPCFLLSLGDREELLPEERKAYREMGYKFRGRQAWPVFRSYHPTYHEWKMTADEMRLATTLVEQSILLALHCKKHRRKWNNQAKNYKIPCCTAGCNLEEMENSISWIPLPEMLQMAEVIPVDEILIKKLKNEVPQYEEAWEFDWFYSPFPIQESKKHVPRRPMILVICDHTSGLMLDFEMLYHEEADIFQFLVKAIQKLKRRPQAIIVSDPFKALSLYKLGPALDCKILIAPHMMIDDFKYTLLEMDSI